MTISTKSYLFWFAQYWKHLQEPIVFGIRKYTVFIAMSSVTFFFIKNGLIDRLLFETPKIVWLSSLRYMYFLSVYAYPPSKKPAFRYLVLIPMIQIRDYWMTKEDQAFSPSYDLAPLASCFSFSVFLWVVGGAYWRQRWGVVGEEPNHTTAKKPGFL